MLQAGLVKTTKGEGRVSGSNYLRKGKAIFGPWDSRRAVSQPAVKEQHID